MELLCHQAPIYGNGTGVASKAGIYDEAPRLGYSRAQAGGKQSSASV